MNSTDFTNAPTCLFPFQIIEPQGFDFYDRGIPLFLSIRIVTIHKSHAPEVQYSISNHWPQQIADLIWNWKALKRPKIQGFYNNTEKISECCVSIGFQ